MAIEDTITQLVGQVGFPIAVTLWFMIRTEKVIGNNTDMLAQVKEVILNCTKKP